MSQLKLTNVNYSTAEAVSINGTGISNGGALVNSGTSTLAGQVTAATNASINAGGGTLNLTGGLVKNGTTATIMGGGSVIVSGTGSDFAARRLTRIALERVEGNLSPAPTTAP